MESHTELKIEHFLCIDSQPKIYIIYKGLNNSPRRYWKYSKNSYNVNIIKIIKLIYII
jgi:hypothetical protein